MSFTVSLTDKQSYVAGTKPVLSRRNQTMADDLHRAVISVSLTHGLDAAKRHEWRVLPTTDCLPERTGEQVFIWMHIPLFLVFLWFTQADAHTTLAIGSHAFAVFHVFVLYGVFPHWTIESTPPTQLLTSTWGHPSF